MGGVLPTDSVRKILPFRIPEPVSVAIPVDDTYRVVVLRDAHLFELANSKVNVADGYYPATILGWTAMLSIPLEKDEECICIPIGQDTQRMMAQ